MPNTTEFAKFPDAAAHWPTNVIAAVVVGFTFMLYFVWMRSYGPTNKTQVPTFWGSVPIWPAWAFYTRRDEFMLEGFDSVKQDIFQFNVTQHKVVAMRGEAARKVFFGDKDLSFTDGYQILLGGNPRVQDIDIKVEKGTGDASELPWFQKRITHLLRKERLAELLPQLLTDIERALTSWPDSGQLNPFDKIYNLVLQLTTRAATCHEIADDPALVAKVGRLYEIIERGSNAKAMVFPWLPNSAVKAKDKALREVYMIISDIIEARRASGSKDQDAIQVLIDLEDSTPDISSFILGTLFAGIVNTGSNACWSLMFLNGNPEWKAKAKVEVQSLLAKYSDSSHGSLTSRLSEFPPNAWEEEMPVMEAIIRETVRILMNAAALRRNVKEDLNIDGKVLERGAFLAYLPSTLHFDDSIYSDPFKFDPDRYSPGREEDKKVYFGFLGWGVGRHPCLGIRFAKLELKLIMALFLMGFEYDHVDCAGKPTHVTARDVDRNDRFQSRPLGKPTYFKYKKIIA